MKFTRSKGQGAASHLGIAIAGALFLGLLSAALVGGAGAAAGQTGSSNGNGEGDDDPGGDDGGGFAADDEFVGTLPTLGDEDVLPFPADAPGFHMEGPRSGVMGTILGAYGSGVVVIEVLVEGGGPGYEGSHPNDIIAMTFLGTVALELDAGLMGNPLIQVGINSENDFGATMAAAMTENDLLMTAVLPASTTLAMPIANFAETGHLQEGIHILTTSRSLGRDQIDISSAGGILRVSQGNPLGL